jgi:hypothetical protein
MNLTRREKIIAVTGIVSVGLLLSFQVFIRPATNRTKTLKRVVSEKREVLVNLQIKSKEYDSLSEHLEQVRKTIANQQTDKKILSLIEGMQRDCGLSKNVLSMTPTTTTINSKYEKNNIEVKYGAVTWDQLIKLLLKIKSSEMLIGIRSLEINRNLQKPDTLDFVIQIVNVTNIDPN